MRDDVVGTAVVDRATHATRRGSWTTVAALGFGAFAIGTDMFVVAGLLAGLAGDLGVTVGAAGSTITVFALAYATGAPVLGALLAPRSLRQVLIGSLVLFGFCNAMAAVAPTLPVLLGARVLSALAASVFVPAAGAAAAAAVPASHRGRAVGVVLGGSSAAMVLGAPLGVLLAADLSWRAAFWLVAGLAAATVLLLLPAGVGSAPQPRSTVGARLRPVRSQAVLATLAVTFLVMTASNSTYTYLAVLLGGAGGPAGLGLLIGAFGLGGIAGTWWGGAAADRSGSRRVVPLAVSVLAAALAVLPLVVATPYVAPVVMVGWGIAAWGFVAAQQHRLIGLDAGPAPLVLALNSSATHLGFAGGAVLGGLVVDAAGADLLWLPAVACCCGALILHTLRTRRERS